MVIVDWLGKFIEASLNKHHHLAKCLTYHGRLAKVVALVLSFLVSFISHILVWLVLPFLSAGVSTMLFFVTLLVFNIIIFTYISAAKVAYEEILRKRVRYERIHGLYHNYKIAADELMELFHTIYDAETNCFYDIYTAEYFIFIMQRRMRMEAEELRRWEEEAAARFREQYKSQTHIYHNNINDLHILGLSPDINDFSVIKSRYRSLAKRYHPDHGGDAEKFKEVASAYNRLKLSFS